MIITFFFGFAIKPSILGTLRRLEGVSTPAGSLVARTWACKLEGYTLAGSLEVRTRACTPVGNLVGSLVLRILERRTPVGSLGARTLVGTTEGCTPAGRTTVCRPGARTPVVCKKVDKLAGNWAHKKECKNTGPEALGSNSYLLGTTHPTRFAKSCPQLPPQLGRSPL
jgi:hypothetical protein